MEEQLAQPFVERIDAFYMLTKSLVGPNAEEHSLLQLTLHKRQLMLAITAIPEKVSSKLEVDMYLNSAPDQGILSHFHSWPVDSQAL